MVDGRVWADNFIVDVLVNGVSTGFRTEGEIGYAGEGIFFGAWDSGLYQRGVNTLTVVVHNAPGVEGGNPDGLLVEVPNAFGLASVCRPAAKTPVTSAAAHLRRTCQGGGPAISFAAPGP